MRGRSHKLLGQYLADRYLTHAPKGCVRWFILGCVQPDRNPTTYLKGSIRSAWLRGHNWSNARRYMSRVSARLEKRSLLRMPDFYALGKLIHYTADAFTYAHNDSFGDDLKHHRSYERDLHRYFSGYIRISELPRGVPADSAMGIIRELHESYLMCPAGVQNDSRHILASCCLVMEALLPPIADGGAFREDFDENPETSYCKAPHSVV